MQLLSYLTFVVFRLGIAALTVLGVATLIFFGMRLIPGNYLDLFFPMADEATRAALAAELGLDRSAWTQYAIWLKDMLQGDFGTSVVTGQPVLRDIGDRLPLTLELAALALVFVACVGFPPGAMSGMFHRNALSQTGRHISTLLMSVPNFVLGSLLLYLFSVNDWGLRAGGWVPLSDGLGDNLRHAILPAFTLSITGLGLVLATARASLLGVMSQDHVLAAVSRGLTPGQIFSRHMFRNALIPVITIFAIVAGYLIGGAVLVEVVFSLDGVGRLLVTAITQRDYPVVQAGVILTATAFVLTNTVADLLYGLVDPRISVSRNG